MFQIWQMGTSSNWIQCSFNISASFFELSFEHKICQVHFILYFLGLSPRSSHFFKESWFLLVENDIQKQPWAAGVHIATGV